MSYFAGLLQGRIESRSAARSAQEWKEIALRFEADLKEAQLAALAIDRHRGRQLAAPLPHHLACGSAPGGSRS